LENQMANILIAATPAPGHVNPMMMVAEHLLSLGHSICFLSGSRFRDRAESIGLEFVPLQGKADIDHDRLDELFPERAAAQPGVEAFNAECIYTGINPIPYQLESIKQILANRTVDLIVTDVYFWGVFPMLLGPKEARPPVLTIGVLPLIVSSTDVGPFSGPDASPEGRSRNQQENLQFSQLFQPAHRRFNEVLRSCGAAELPEFFIDCAAHLPDRYLCLSAKGFEYPRSDLKSTIQFVGNLAPLLRADASLPHWWGALDTSRPVVLVTQGTIANKDLSQLIEPAIAALADENMTVIVATGRPDLDAIHFPQGVRPRNVEIEPFVPFELVLPKIDVFVTNGGYGAVNMALSKGVPMVVAGDTEDKIFTSARVAWTQTGINLQTGRPTIEQLRSAVHEVLRDRTYKDNAVKLQKEMAGYNTRDLTAKAVDSLLA
jgi:MGT family glycosyltransferase